MEALCPSCMKQICDLQAHAAGPPAQWVSIAASNRAAERREQKMVQTADPSPGKQNNNKQLLLLIKPSYVTCLASTITGFFLRTDSRICISSSFPELGVSHWSCVSVGELGTLGSSEFRWFMHRAKEKAGTERVYQSLAAWSGMETCTFNKCHNPNFHSPDYTLWFSNSWEQFRKSGFPGPGQGHASPSLPHAFRPFFAYHHLASWAHITTALLK